MICDQHLRSSQQQHTILVVSTEQLSAGQLSAHCCASAYTYIIKLSGFVHFVKSVRVALDKPTERECTHKEIWSRAHRAAINGDARRRQAATVGLVCKLLYGKGHGF